jgi:hypothetical protein
MTKSSVIATMVVVAGLALAGSAAMNAQMKGFTGGNDTSAAGGAWRQTRASHHMLVPKLVNPYQYILEFLANVPDGTSVDQSQFDQVLGAEAGTLLRSLNVTHIDAKRGTVKVTLSKPYDTTTDAAEIRVDTTLTFTHQLTTTGTLICDNISGLSVKAVSLFGFMPVKHVEVSHDTAGNTTIEVEVSSPFGTIKKTVRLDPDGKQLP